MLDKKYFSPDIFDFLVLLNRYNVKYVIVGGEAVIYYGYARLTGDIDIFYSIERENIDRIWKVLLEFWDGDIPGIKSQTELTKRGIVIQFGMPPNRIDLINEIDGVEFEEVWQNITKEEIFITENDKISINFIGIKELIENKKKSNRYKDKEDLKYLNSSQNLKKDS